MKRILLFSLISILLSACSLNDSKLSFSKIKRVPNNVQTKIEPTFPLQLLNEKEEVSYLIYQTKGTVATDLEVQKETVQIKLDVSSNHSDDVKQHVYKITLDPNQEVIDVLINGKSTPFDKISSL